jgi:hypothetical protein
MPGIPASAAAASAHVACLTPPSPEGPAAGPEPAGTGDPASARRGGRGIGRGFGARFAPAARSVTHVSAAT